MLAGDGLPTLKSVVQTHGLDAQKSLGQNFLFDLNLTGRIARTAGPLTGHCVLEIGPGPGGLTRALLAEGAEKVVVIEADRRFEGALNEIASHYPGKLEIEFSDALKTDHRALLEQHNQEGLPVKIVANLPYNVGTALLVDWLTIDPWPPFWGSLTLMFQREVAERIVAEPKDPHYGRLAVLCDLRAKSQICFDVSPKAFSPPPKVTSSIVHLTPRETPLFDDLSALERITKTAFGQRRKMLRQSLKPLGGKLLIERAGLLETARPETLSTDDFIALAKALKTED